MKDAELLLSVLFVAAVVAGSLVSATFWPCPWSVSLVVWNTAHGPPGLVKDSAVAGLQFGMFAAVAVTYLALSRVTSAEEGRRNG